MKVSSGLRQMGLWLLAPVGLWLLTLAGCAGGDEPRCQVVGVGEGICCTLTTASGEQRDGACIEGACTDGVDRDFTNSTCGGGVAPPDRDQGGLRIDFATRLDRGGAGGVGGGAGGAGGAGGEAGEGGLGGEGGGPGGAGGAGGDGGEGGAGGVAGAGGGGDRCADVSCPAGQRCNPATGLCQAGAAGGCTDDDGCEVGVCLTEADTEGAVPGGFCRLECANDAECGVGGTCQPNGETRLCFASCGPARACRGGWACLPVLDPEGQPTALSRCVPDCRQPAVGCPQGFGCNGDTGACEAAPTCRYPCAAGETCDLGRCVRANGTCVTDYHCANGETQCYEGQCIRPELSNCVRAADCTAPQQQCAPFDANNPLDGGLCLYNCQNDAECPVDRLCLPGLNGCYVRFCGSTEQNGNVYSNCSAGAQNQYPGTCLPLVGGALDQGLCIEAGNVPEGGACDSQVEGRAPVDRNLQCQPGLLCFDDPDDPLDPGRNWANRGACSQLCDPRANRCASPARTCIDFSDPDDPSTPEDDGRYIGLCLASDCTVAQNNCFGGQICRPYSLNDARGRCGAAGAAPFGAACTDNDDCGGLALCANAGFGPVCLPICDPAAPACPGASECRTDPAWGFGVCL